ncbi:hypothetical protein MHM84_20545 [Halomonas sp. McH1-25]|uniref:hypothetical protein n=1 Tax=unclassified Halomonas TaxID=2609666 RepID=UPI001EF4CDEC|nr:MULTISPECIES: hypothetical protein [unclassified Halomonas]MCG7602129.1 hypothetical protein [Halomonas sp. McH1-25]MCP1344414.1 hypothetical protein [Halomonas sp. FL8]MCP1362496.1 hypothetical protein [Halomonas sp. BBD45]
MVMQAHYELVLVTDLFVLIRDRDDGGRTITHDAQSVVARVDAALEGLGKRRLYYQDTDGRFDELSHREGTFLEFRLCSDHQQAYFLEQLSTANQDTHCLEEPA